MSSLKELRSRKKSVQSTKKITAAMKMIAAAKLRYAQIQAQTSRPYADGMNNIFENLLSRAQNMDSLPPLLVGTGKDLCHLVVVLTSDRGLCGGFNNTVVRAATSFIEEQQKAGREIKIFCIGRKGYEQMRRKYGNLIIEKANAFAKPLFRDSVKITKTIVEEFSKDAFDHCTIIYNKFISALSQKVTRDQIIPFKKSDSEDRKLEMSSNALYEFEPKEDKLLQQLLPKNLSIQIFRALSESAASEHGARMTAMDSATRNAEDMIKDLELTYNRTRQAYITKELIEIISGAEAL